MAAEAGWYDDPTKRGRLRYWDGGAWTEHVSAGGGTTLDPITSAAPEPPARPEPARDPGPTVTSSPAPTIIATAPAQLGLLASGGPYPATLLGRAGLALGAVAGVLFALSFDKTAVEQLDGNYTLTVDTEVIALGLIATVLCLAAAAAPWFWARLTGVGLTALGGLVTASFLTAWRTDEDLLADVDVGLGSGGALVAASALVFWLATAVALIFLRRPVTAPDPAAAPSNGKGVAALVTGIVGVFIPVTSAVAIGLALLAFDDHRATEGRIGGRGMAVAGLVLGIVSLALWGIGLTLAMFLATP